MITKFDPEKLEAFASHFAAQLKNESDLNDLSKALLKATVERALQGKLDTILVIPRVIHQAMALETVVTGVRQKLLRVIMAN